MQIGSNWIRFSYKPPYSSLPGKVSPCDFLVIYAYLDSTSKNMKYQISKASTATKRYKLHPDEVLAWRTFEEYRAF